MQLEEGFHRPAADLLVALPADALQLVAEALAVPVAAVVGPFEVVLAGEDARGEHGGREAGALLVGPVGDDDGMPRLYSEVVEGADHFQPAEHAEHAVILAAGGLGVEMRADIDGRQARVRALAAGEHGAHFVDAHGQAGILAPALEQVAALAVLVG